MKIEFDPAKREWTLRKRALDFRDASLVLDGPQFTLEDLRRDYGEQRFITFGMLEDLMVVLAWTLRTVDGEPVRRIISMRRANEREIARYSQRLG